jgi:tetratricopeptide (TPR) repeat protein
LGGWSAEHRTKRYADAVKDFDAAIELDSKRADWYDDRARAYADWGKFDKAIVDFTAAIELSP